jgi:hypothetical protein
MSGGNINEVMREPEQLAGDSGKLHRRPPRQKGTTTPERTQSPSEIKAETPPAGLSCSFCRKTYSEVAKLISNPYGTARICDQCIAVCWSILEDSKVLQIQPPLPE